MKVISTGIDLLKAHPKKYLGPRGKKKVAGLCHPSSVTNDFTHLVEILEQNSDLAVLFGPQHGIHGETQDNMIEWQTFRDKRTALPAYSLYGETRKPTPEMLGGVDILVFDIQDVGTRVYTFIYTMALAMEAAHECGKRFVVLDRPNPIGGVQIADTDHVPKSGGIKSG